MNTKRIDGILFERMVREGLSGLIKCEKTINALNVFPVADGDTGTNMRMTLESGIRCAVPCEALNEYLKALSGGMLLGARGNSGVILSQIFKGIYLELSRNEAASPVMLRNAFIRGYKVAYESVIKPVEGTILTVAREGIEFVIREQKRLKDLETLLTVYIAAMQISLKNTPNLLPILAEMNVVDSGAQGYIVIVSGMLAALTGQVPSDMQALAEPDRAAAPPASNEIAPDFSRFTETSAFDEGYCMEFILQLMRTDGYSQEFDQSKLLKMLEANGNSLVVVRDGARVKVHVHTKKPAPIIEYVQRFGEFLTFKLENMQLQHNEFADGAKAAGAAKQAQTPKKSEHCLLGTVAVVNGAGAEAIFRDLGCKLVIDGGATMNTSSEEFLEAINSIDADRIVIIPNGPNMMLAAQQAVALSNKENVVILPAKTLAQGYFALAMDVADSTDPDLRIRQMRRGMESVETLLVTRAARDYSRKDISCRENEFIALSNNELLCTSPDPVETVINGMKLIEGIEDKETCIFFRGAEADAALEKIIAERIESEFPMLEVTFEWGGQALYDWIAGIS